MISDRKKIWLYRLWYGTHTNPSRARPWIIGGFFAILAVTAIIFATFGRGWHLEFRRAQALNLVAEAQEFKKKGAPMQAIQAMNNAYKKASSEPDVIRAYALMCMHYRIEGGLFLFSVLRDRNILTTEDALAEAELNYALNRWSRATSLCEEILSKDDKNMAATNLYARVLSVSGKPETATAFFKKSLEYEIRNPTPAALVDTAQFLFSLPPSDQPSKELLAELADAVIRLGDSARDYGLTNAQRNACYRLAVLSPSLTPRTIAKLADAAWSHSELTADTRFNLLKLLPFSAQSDAINARLRKFNSLGTFDKSLIAMWLSDQSNFQKVIDLIPPSVAKEDEQLLKIYLGALVKMNRVDLVREILNDKNLPLDPTTLEILLGIVHLSEDIPQQQREIILTRMVKQALAKPQPQMLLYTASIALSFGFRAQALAALDPTLNSPSMAGNALKIWDDYVRNQGGSATEVMELNQHALLSNPSSMPLLLNQIYFQILIGKEMETAANTLSSFPGSYANQQTVLLLRDFLRYRQHLPVKNLAAIEALKPNQMADSERLIAALLLVSNGRASAAQHHITWLGLAKLLQEEAAIYQQIKAATPKAP